MFFQAQEAAVVPPVYTNDSRENKDNTPSEETPPEAVNPPTPAAEAPEEAPAPAEQH